MGGGVFKPVLSNYDLAPTKWSLDKGDLWMPVRNLATRSEASIPALFSSSNYRPVGNSLFLSYANLWWAQLFEGEVIISAEIIHLWQAQFVYSDVSRNSELSGEGNYADVLFHTKR